MNGQEIYQEQFEVKEVLKKAPQKIYTNGVAFAEKQQAYRLGMKEAMLKRKEEGMAVGMIEKVARGDCAELEFEMTVAEMTLKAAEENANVSKRLLDSIEATIRREQG